MKVDCAAKSSKRQISKDTGSDAEKDSLHIIPHSHSTQLLLLE
jgi:hypothetical protein